MTLRNQGPLPTQVGIDSMDEASCLLVQTTKSVLFFRLVTLSPLLTATSVLVGLSCSRISDGISFVM